MEEGEALIQTKGFAGIGLDNPKSVLNVGSAMRACQVYRAQFLVVSGTRYKKAHDKSPSTDTMKYYRHFPVFQVPDLRDMVPQGCIPVAVDIIEGAKPLPGYTHPKRAFYIFGAEDATLDERTLEWCQDIVYIPTNRCMNLAATVNVVLYDRFSKGL